MPVCQQKSQFIPTLPVWEGYPTLPSLPKMWGNVAPGTSWATADGAPWLLWRVSFLICSFGACFSWCGLCFASGVCPQSSWKRWGRFATLQVFDRVTRCDQRNSGGFGMDVYACVYYLLLSLVLSKITVTERAQAIHSCPCDFPFCAPCALEGWAVCCPPSFRGMQGPQEQPPAPQLLQALSLKCRHPTKRQSARGVRVLHILV